MKLRDRLGFFQHPEPREDEPEETSPQEATREARIGGTPAHEAGAGPGDEPSHGSEPAAKSPERAERHGTEGERERDPLGAALSTVARTVAGEIESARRGVHEVEARLSARIEAEKDGAVSAVDAVKSELSSRIDELRRSQEESLAEQAARTRESVDELRESVERAESQADERSRQMKDDLERTAAEKQRELQQRLEALSKTLAKMRRELQQQIATSASVSALLNDLAHVFAGQEAEARSARQAGGPAPAPAGDPSKTVPARGLAELAEDGDPKEVDDALSRVFR